MTHVAHVHHRCTWPPERLGCIASTVQLVQPCTFSDTEFEGLNPETLIQSSSARRPQSHQALTPGRPCYGSSVGNPAQAFPCQQRLVRDGAQAGIRKVRDAKAQVALMGVPQKHLGGHAFHTYRCALLRSMTYSSIWL